LAIGAGERNETELAPLGIERLEGIFFLVGIFAKGSQETVYFRLEAEEHPLSGGIF
jgi:hypothetical protein